MIDKLGNNLLSRLEAARSHLEPLLGSYNQRTRAELEELVPKTEKELDKFIDNFEKISAVLDEFGILDETPIEPYDIQQGYKRVLDHSFSFNPEELLVARKRYVDTLCLARKFSEKKRPLPCLDLRVLAKTQLVYDKKIQPLRSKVILNEELSGKSLQDFYAAIAAEIPKQNTHVLASYGFSRLNTHLLRPEFIPRLILLVHELELQYYSLDKTQRTFLDRLRNQAHARIDAFAAQSKKENDFSQALYLPYLFRTCSVY